MAGKKGKVSCPAYLFYEQNKDGSKKIGGIQGCTLEYQTKGAACADVSTPIGIKIPAHSAVKSDLWIGFEIPKGWKIVMYPRSSLLIKYNLIQPVSIIDSDYSGMHVHVPLYNPTNEDIFLPAGTRVAQIECQPCHDCEDWYHKKAEREGGFGSTGK